MAHGQLRQILGCIIASSLLVIHCHVATAAPRNIADGDGPKSLPQKQLPRQYTGMWAVHVPDGHEHADQVAAELGFENLGQIGAIKNHFHFRHVCDDPNGCLPPFEHAHNHTHAIVSHHKVHWAEQQKELSRPRRLVVSDPMYKAQWYLHDKGKNIDVEAAWDKGYTGKGVVVTIVDDGIEHDHPDLVENYDPKASTDLNSYDPDPYPREEDPINKHGTRCSGEVAASKNSVCGIGVAYHSSIGAVRMLDGSVTDSVEAHSLGLNPDHIDIYSNSWGPNDDGRSLEGPGTLARQAIENGVKYGRNGKGSIFLFASGNGGRYQDNCNCDGYANSMYTIAISAISEGNNVPWYSENCAAAIASTYSSGSGGERSITTTDLHKRCTSSHTGTSAAAPLAAGIYALVLEANPNLTWRDIQHVTIRAAQQVGSGQWVTNGVGHHIHPKFGFGNMDVGEMVRLAESWTNVGPLVDYDSETKTVNQEIPHASSAAGALESTIVVAPSATSITKLEHVQVQVNIVAPKRGDIHIDLESPSGTISELLSVRTYDSTSAGIHWTFMTVRCWDESPVGMWKLVVRNHISYTREAKLQDWKLLLHGTGGEVHADCKSDEFVNSAGKCESCPTGTYLLGTRCEKCDASCGNDGCNSFGPEGCNSCKNFAINGVCQACDSECADGCTGPGPTECLGCAHESEMTTDSSGKTTITCVGKCNFMEYPDENEVCQPCNEECADGCGGGKHTQCLACKNFEVIVSSQAQGLAGLAGQHSCVASCPIGTYEDGNNCLACDLTCGDDGCTGAGPYRCKSCRNFGVHFLTGNEDSVYECVDQCPETRVADPTSKECVCAPNTFELPQDLFCQGCNTECVDGCDGPGPEHCNSGCAHYQFGIQCVAECPPLSYASTDDWEKAFPQTTLNAALGACIPCHAQCASGCSGPTSADCVDGDHGVCIGFEKDGACQEECPSGTFGTDDFACLPCDQECNGLGCVGPLSSDCLQCTHYEFGDDCVVECPSGTYSDSNRICRRCDEECEVCFGPGSQSCFKDEKEKSSGDPPRCKNAIFERDCVSSCPSNYYATPTNLCVPCSDQCATCDGDGEDSCLTCRFFSLESSKCVTSCPTTTFPNYDSMACTACHSSCGSRGCTGPTESDCNECMNECEEGKTANPDNNCVCETPICQGYEFEGICLDSCTENLFVESGKTCKQCDEECNGCTGPSPKDCKSCKHVEANGQCLTSCPNGATESNGKCIPCNDQCENGCTGPTAADCVSCKSFYHGGMCMEQCPTNTFASDKRCHNCASECEGGCDGPGIGGCTQCKDYKYESTCVAECPVHTYANAATKECKHCSSECATGCNGPSPSDCNSCKNLRDFVTRMCVEECTVGTTYIENNVCKKCHYLCDIHAGCRGPNLSDCGLVRTTPSTKSSTTTGASDQQKNSQGSSDGSSKDSNTASQTEDSGVSNGKIFTIVAVSALVISILFALSRPMIRDRLKRLVGIQPKIQYAPVGFLQLQNEDDDESDDFFVRK